MAQSTPMKFLSGMTWDHPRGLDGLVAADRHLQVKFGVSISWQARSLLAFGDQHISEFAADFDFLIIDHPHVPDAVEAGAILPLNRWTPTVTLDCLALESVGESHNSYFYKGDIWAFAIDAAAQVSAYREGTGGVPPYWADVLSDAKSGRVIWPYKPVDSFSTFTTMMAQLGKPLFGNKQEILHLDTARQVFETLIELAANVPNECSSMNPIDAAELLSSEEQFDYSPALYGYTNYSRKGFRKHRLQYDDVVSFDGRAGGSQLGGAGIAVSASTKDPRLASQIAAYLSLGDVQSSSYTRGGGQPGNLRAWMSPELNDLTNNFFRNSLRTLERAWVRPRILGYPDYQLAFSLVVHDALVRRSFNQSTLNQLLDLPDIYLKESQ